MLLEADLVVRHKGCLVSECLTEGAYAAQVSADREGDVIVMSGPTEAHVERFVAAVRATQSRTPAILARSDTSVVVRGRDPDSGVVATINRSGCTILWPSVWSAGLERFTILAADRPQLDRLVATLSRLGDVNVSRVSDVDVDSLSLQVSLATLTEGFTERQMDALHLAMEDGYYDAPRATSSEALASKLGTSRATFEEHLRKAERRALQRFLAAVAAHAPLRRARGRRGRPPARVSTRFDSGRA